MKRDKRRVLVASVICYTRAFGTFSALIEQNTRNEDISMTSSSVSTSIPRTDSLIAISTENRKVTVSSADGRDLSQNASILSLLNKRLGDACNEIRKILLSTVKELLGTYLSRKSPAAPILLSVQFWFQQGLDHFEECNDLKNISLLWCNLFQCCKICSSRTYLAAMILKISSWF
jgi:hypothetical protein